MRAWVAGALLWVVLGGVASAAPQVAGRPPQATVRKPATAGASADTPVDVAMAAGRPLKVPEPTYQWHGLTVPVGACGAVVGGRAMVLPCNDPRVGVYRKERLRERVAAARRWAWTRDAGAAAGVALAFAGGTVLIVRRRSAALGRTLVRRDV